MLTRILWAGLGGGLTIVLLSCALILPAIAILVGLALMLPAPTLGLMATIERSKL